MKTIVALFIAALLFGWMGYAGPSQVRATAHAHVATAPVITAPSATRLSGGVPPATGVSNSPTNGTIANGVLYISYGNDRGRVYALKPSNGRKIWSRPCSGGCSA